MMVLQAVLAQQVVQGTVTDQNGQPIPGATVVVKGTSTATSADFDGNFAIAAANGDVLVASYVGFAASEATVSGLTLNFTLSSSTNLDEVIVTGFGEVSKTTFAGSATNVSGEILQEKSYTNVSQALSGEAAGVAVFNTSGQPGTSSTIRIRGFGSVNGSRSPLIIVDNAPFSGSYNDINPNDIKSVTVLKDASATTPYGARGANGVIVITTKRGNDSDKGGFTVELKKGTNYQGLGRYDVIKSADEYIGISWEAAYQRGMITNAGDSAAAIAYANDNLFESTTNADISDIPAQYNIWNAETVSDLIDPATATVRPGVTRKYDPENWEDYSISPSDRDEVLLTFSTSGDKSSVYTSFGFINDKGYAVNSAYERLNARIAITQDINEKLSINSTLGYTQSESNSPGQGSSSNSQFWWLDNIPSIYPLFLRDSSGQKIPDPIYGGYLYDYGTNGRGFGFATNGVAQSYVSINRSKNNSVNFNNNIKYKITDDLKLSYNVGYQYFMNDGISHDEPFYSQAAGGGGAISRSRGETKNFTSRFTLKYDKDFGDLDLSAFASHVANSYEFNYLYAERTNLVLPQGINISNGVVNAAPDGYTDELTNESYILSANLGFKEKYFFTATYNRDATSRFINDKWGDFYGLGLAWVISEEDYFSSDIFDFLKFKASYGQIGNSGGVGLYPGYNIYSVNNLNDKISLAFTTKGNKDLTWETSNQFNAGVEFEIGGFITGSLEAYNKLTNDMFFTRSTGPSVGYASIQVNDGELVNTGVEFDLDFDILKESKFKLNLSVNGESFVNELTALPIDPATGEEQKFDTSGVFGREKGRSLYEFYFPVYTGVNSDNGAAQWERYFDDVNGDGVYNAADDVIVQSLVQYQNDNPSSTLVKDITEVYAEATDQFTGYEAIPDLRGSFRLNASYGDFSLTAQFNYQIGGYAYDSAYANLMDNDFLGANNYHTDIRNRWKSPGDVTNIPRLDARAQLQQNSSSTRFLTKADYLALNNIRIGYQISKDVLDIIGAETANIYVSGDNLWLSSKRTGFNPSSAVLGGSNWYRYNPLSTLVFGLKITL